MSPLSRPQQLQQAMLPLLEEMEALQLEQEELPFQRLSCWERMVLSRLLPCFPCSPSLLDCWLLPPQQTLQQEALQQLAAPQALQHPLLQHLPALPPPLN